MLSVALATAPPSAYKVLAALVAGRPKESNGKMCLTASYAKQFGINSHDTLTRTLKDLQERGLVVVTREVPRLKKWPTLYAVTWWPIYYQNGEKLGVPEKESRTYEKWTPPPKRVQKFPCPDSRDTTVPIAGIQKPPHRPDFVNEKANHRPDSRAQSKSFGR